MFNRITSFPHNQMVITPSDTVRVPREDMLIEAGSDGTIRTEDRHGRIVDRTVTRGQVIPVLVRKVHATGTTVNPVIGLY